MNKHSLNTSDNYGGIMHPVVIDRNDAAGLLRVWRKNHRNRYGLSYTVTGGKPHLHISRTRISENIHNTSYYYYEKDSLLVLKPLWYKTKTGIKISSCELTVYTFYRKPEGK